MRSSKSRSRSKSNRNNNNNNRTVGNVVNRVFDSSGPEGKVRGTPQQIIDKYNQLARDAQLAGDRVATENFQQHAEHYTRMLSEAQREQDARRDEQERQNRERQAQRDRERTERQERDMNGGQMVEDDSDRGDRGDRNGRADDGDHGQSGQRSRSRKPDPSEQPQPDVLEFTSGASDGDSNIVETPENAAETKPKKSTRSRASRKPAPKPEPEPQAEAGGAASE